MPNLSRDRGKIFDEIMEQKIIQKQVELSDHYQKIADRVDLLPHLERMSVYFCRFELQEMTLAVYALMDTGKPVRLSCN